MQAREAQARTQAARNVLVGETGEGTRIDGHVRYPAEALDFPGLGCAEVARIAHLDDEVLGAARIAGKLALAPPRVIPRAGGRRGGLGDDGQGGAHESGWVR